MPMIISYVKIQCLLSTACVNSLRRCCCKSVSLGLAIDWNTSLTLTVLVTAIDAEWEGIGDVG